MGGRVVHMSAKPYCDKFNEIPTPLLEPRSSYHTSSAAAAASANTSTLNVQLVVDPIISYLTTPGDSVCLIGVVGKASNIDDQICEKVMICESPIPNFLVCLRAC